MKVLFDLSHPAHVHLFKNTILKMQLKNHKVFIVARNKDIVFKLLNSLNLPFTELCSPKRGFIGLTLELLHRNYELFKLCKTCMPDIMIGTSVNIAHIGKILGIKTLVFNEDDEKVVPLFAKLAYPFAYKVIKPDCLSFEKGKNDVYHSSFHELAYLHPNHFSLDLNILNKYNLKPYTYIIIRLSALSAHHDKGVKGINNNLVQDLKNIFKNYKIIFSKELFKRQNVNPIDMHHILGYAKMLVSDSQTMTAEASVLGVPSIRCNSFVGKLAYLNELEKRYNLTFGFLPEFANKICEKVNDLLDLPDLTEDFRFRKERMLKDKCDLSDWISEFIEI